MGSLQEASELERLAEAFSEAPTQQHLTRAVASAASALLLVARLDLVARTPAVGCSEVSLQEGLVAQLGLGLELELVPGSALVLDLVLEAVLDQDLETQRARHSSRLSRLPMALALPLSVPSLRRTEPPLL